MTVEVIMPQLGESIVEGTVTKWLKQVDEPVREFEPLVEINTDKVDTEVPSPASGTLLARFVDEGQTVKAGTVLALIGEPGEPMPKRGDGGARPAGAQRPVMVAVWGIESNFGQFTGVRPTIAALATLAWNSFSRSPGWRVVK